MKYLTIFVFAIVLGACSDPQEKPISSKEQSLLLSVLNTHPELQAMYDAAKVDGVISKREFLNILYQVSEASTSNTPPR